MCDLVTGGKGSRDSGLEGTEVSGLSSRKSASAAGIAIYVKETEYADELVSYSEIVVFRDLF